MSTGRSCGSTTAAEPKDASPVQSTPGTTRTTSANRADNGSRASTALDRGLSECGRSSARNAPGADLTVYAFEELTAQLAPGLDWPGWLVLSPTAYAGASVELRFSQIVGKPGRRLANTYGAPT